MPAPYMILRSEHGALTAPIATNLARTTLCSQLKKFPHRHGHSVYDAEQSEQGERSALVEKQLPA
jgi:hypothetical protein